MSAHTAPHKAKIVIVEDDPLLMRVYQEAFKTRGYAVETFFNGNEALSALERMKENERPLIILSDVMMPGMNGIELLTHLKELPDYKKIPVVLITNLAQLKTAKEGLSIGAIAYLVKGDYSMKELVSKIEEFIQIRKEKDIPETRVAVKDMEEKAAHPHHHDKKE